MRRELKNSGFASVVFLSTIVFSVSCGITSSKKNDSGRESTTEENANTNSEEPRFTPVDDDSSTPPVEINGSFLTGLSCIVTNQSDAEATDTAVTCKLQDKRGEKFGGKVEDVNVKIVLGNSTVDVAGLVTVLDSEASDTFVAVFPGVSPQNALGIEMSATLDGEKVNLQSSFTNGGATVSLANKDLYISADADAANAACSKEAPCKTIRRAMLFVPDIVGHAINLHVAAGTYPEALRISGKTIRKGGRLHIVGEAANWDGSPGVIKLSGEYLNNAETPNITISANNGSDILIKNFEIESCTRYGIFADNSPAYISNITVTPCLAPPLTPALNGLEYFTGLFVDNKSSLTIRDGLFRINAFSFQKYIQNPECATNPVDANPACKRFQTIGISVVRNSQLGTLHSDITISASMDVGIKITERSIFAVSNHKWKTKITINNASRAIAVYNESIFRDFDATAYPSLSEDNRPTISAPASSYGISVERSEFTAAFAHINFSSCIKGCLSARDGGKITIGRDAFSSVAPVNIVSKVVLNSVPATPSAAEGYLGFADIDSRISILSTVEDLQMCHTSTVTAAPFEVNIGASILIRAKKTTLSAVTALCADASLGNVKVNLGQISISSSSTTQESCAGGSNLKTCIDTEFAKP